MIASALECRLIEQFEGYSYKAYWDSYGKRWTDGYGRTIGVSSGSTATRAQAENWLGGWVGETILPKLYHLNPKLNPNVIAGAASACYNLGVGCLDWSFGTYLREGNISRAAAALLGYDTAGGVVLAGLVTRRHDEARVMLTPYVAPDPHHYLRYNNNLERYRVGNHLMGLHERNTAEAYDKLYANRSTRHKAVALRPAIKLARDRVYHNAHIDGVHWNLYFRTWRWQTLDQRLVGAVKL